MLHNSINLRSTSWVLTTQINSLIKVPKFILKEFSTSWRMSAQKRSKIHIPKHEGFTLNGDCSQCPWHEKLLPEQNLEQLHLIWQPNMSRFPLSLNLFKSIGFDHHDIFKIKTSIASSLLFLRKGFAPNQIFSSLRTMMSFSEPIQPTLKHRILLQFFSFHSKRDLPCLYVATEHFHQQTAKADSSIQFHVIKIFYFSTHRGAARKD